MTTFFCDDCGKPFKAKVTGIFCPACCRKRNGYKFGEWIPVTEMLPEEHESVFAKIYETEKWEPYMFCMTSDDVLAVVEFEDGTRKVKTVRTTDGQWRLLNIFRAKEITHWMPLPEPPKEDGYE